MAQSFKVGDRAKPVGEQATNWNYGLVKITQIRIGNTFPIRAISDTGEIGLFLFDELELIPEIQKTELSMLPTDAKKRKQIPLGTGLFDYFPAALIEVAKVSFAGNQQHNPGQPLHWARGKSTDQEDTMLRHFLERGTLDSDGVRHSAKMCWRALAILQLELEAEGVPIARGAK